MRTSSQCKDQVFAGGQDMINGVSIERASRAARRSRNEDRQFKDFMRGGTHTKGTRDAA